MKKSSYDALGSENYQRIAEAVGDANPILDVGRGEGELANLAPRWANMCEALMSPAPS